MREKFFDEAKKESYLSDYNKQHLGAVAVYQNKFILARAHNCEKTNPTQYYFDRYRIPNRGIIVESKGHAEINLVRKIRYLDIDFSKVTIYIYREFKDGSPALSRPCPACEQALKSLGIKKVCYTTNAGYCEEHFVDFEKKNKKF